VRVALSREQDSAMFGKRLDMLGGVILVLLGTKILVQHLLAR
jgi:putative Mn2+ efflux pump MntP